MSATPPATPPSANTGTGNLKVLATKNQLLQQIDDTVASLITQLEYKREILTRTKSYSVLVGKEGKNVKQEIDKAVKELREFGTTKQTLGTKIGETTGKAVDTVLRRKKEETEESLAKKVKKGDQNALKNLETIREQEMIIQQKQEEINQSELKLRELKVKEQQTQREVDVADKKTNVVGELEEKQNKTRESFKDRLADATRELEIVQGKKQYISEEEYNRLLKVAQDKKNSIEAEKVAFEANAKATLDKEKQENAARTNLLETKREELSKIKTEIDEEQRRIDNSKSEIADAQAKISDAKKLTKTQSGPSALSRGATNTASFIKKGAKATASGIATGAKATASGIATGAKATASGIATGAKAISKRTKAIFNREQKYIAEEDQKPLDISGINPTVIKGGAAGPVTLASLLRDYRAKVYITKEEYKKLEEQMVEFEKKYDTSYKNISNNVLDSNSATQTTFKLLWETDGFKKSFPLGTKLYIQKLFASYNNALVEEEKAIKAANPVFTDQQVKEELDKRIRGVLPAKDKKTLGGPEEGVGKNDTDKGGPPATREEGEGGEDRTSSASPMGSAIGKGLMDGFNILYTIFGALGAILVLGTFFLSCIDILKFSVLEVWQYIMLFINPNMFNKDTLDFSTLLYAKNSEKEEPYTIFLQQEFISFMFKLVTYFVQTVCLQVLLFIVLKLLKSFGKVEFEEGLDFGPAKKAIGVMVITIASAFIQNTYYNTTFLNSLQPDLIASTDNIRDMADTMYNNMTNHSEFLDNVVQENLSECIRIMNAQGDRPQAIGSMIFTLSLYNFFKINIPSESPTFNTVREVFSLKERKVRSINPTSYMYFQQNVFIPNLYAMIEPYISGSTNALNTKAKRDAVRKDVALRITRLNQLLMGLFVVPNRRSSFRNYIYFGWILALAFVVGIYSIYREEIDLIYENFVKPFLTALNEFFWNIVLPWDTRSSKKEEAPK